MNFRVVTDRVWPKRAVAWRKRIVILDEPTASLRVVQTKNVLDIVRRVADSGVAVVLVSHSMPDVLSVADRIEVLRVGRRVAQFWPGRGIYRASGLRHDGRGQDAIDQQWIAATHGEAVIGR